MPTGYGPGGPGMPPRPGTRPGGQGRFPIGLIFLLIMAVLLVVYFTASDRNGSPLGRTGRVNDSLQEVVQRAGTGDYKVAVVSAEGMLLDQRSDLLGLALSPVEQIEYSLARIDADERVRGMLLRVNSPGGGLTASDKLFQTIERHVSRWRQQRPGFQYTVVMEDVAASGGYYIAAGADRIIAQPTTITGSIGVMMSTLNFAGLFEKLGIEDMTVTSAPYKDLGNPFTPPKPMERLYFRGMLDQMHERFVQVVYDGRRRVLRDLTRERVADWADGRIFTAQEALSLGLIDAIGYEEDAIGWMQGNIDPNESPTVVRYEPKPLEINPFSFIQHDEGGLSASASELALLQQLLKEERRETLASPRVWALWSPGLALLPPLDARLAGDGRTGR